MKALVTGAQGQIGRALLQTVPPGVDVLGFGRNELDVSNEDAVRNCVSATRPDVVLNAAAYTAVDRAESEPAKCNSVNVEGARILALAAQEHGARLLHLSTDFVYDGTSSIPYSPDSVPCPLSVYGKSKWRGEQAVLGILGDRAAVLRTAWVYAAWGNNFVRTMLRLMAERGAVNVVSDQVGTPTAALSAARALWTLALRAEVHGIHHWTDAGVASWYDLAVAVAEEGARLQLVPATVEVIPIATQEYPTPARRPRYSVLDNSSTRAALDLVPVHWRKNLRNVLEEIARG